MHASLPLVHTSCPLNQGGGQTRSQEDQEEGQRLQEVARDQQLGLSQSGTKTPGRVAAHLEIFPVRCDHTCADRLEQMKERK